jgi:FG-GAP-like repeat
MVVMGRSRNLTALIAAAVITIGTAARGDEWETTRKTVIDPINSEFHRHLPQYVKARDLEQIVSLYAVETGTGLSWDGARPVYTQQEEEMLRWGPASGAERIRDRYQHLLDLFPTVDKAELRIHRILFEQEDPKGYPARVRLIVRGTRGDGAAAQLDQTMRVHIALSGKNWRITQEEVIARELVARRKPRFVRATEEAGIKNVHTNAGSPVFRMVSGTTSTAGSAVADVDGDGCEDIFLPGRPDASLYKNNCDGTFTDVTEQWGIPHPFPAVASAAVFFDYDNDGRPDLFVASVKGGNRLFHNVVGKDGNPRFVDVTEKAGIPEGEWSASVAVADYDRDGFLDVYIVRMGDHEKTTPKPNYQANNGLPNILLHNEGDGTFTDVTRKAHVGDRGWGLAGAWGDYDDDGYPDLYVANEYGFSVLYHNEKDGTFEDVSESSGARIRTAGMGVAWADYDGDGKLDLFVSAMYANSRWALFHPAFPAPIPWYYRWLGHFTSEVKRRSDEIIEDLTRGSTLLRNNGNGTFTDVSEKAGVRDAQWGWGAEFLDYDNDGKLDLFSQNGFVTGDLPDDI